LTGAFAGAARAAELRRGGRRRRRRSRRFGHRRGRRQLGRPHGGERGREPSRLGDAAHRLHHRRVLHHHRDGRARDRVDGDVTLARRADRDAVEHGLAAVLVGEGAQPLLGDARGEDRLLVVDDREPGDAPGEVEPDQRVDRLARIGGNAHDVGGEEHVAEQPVAAVDGRGRRRALEDAEPVGLGEEAPRLRVVGGEPRRARTAEREQRGEEQHDEGASGGHRRGTVCHFNRTRPGRL
jgi:hypothetical protein